MWDHNLQLCHKYLVAVQRDTFAVFLQIMQVVQQDLFRGGWQQKGLRLFLIVAHDKDALAAALAQVRHHIVAILQIGHQLSVGKGLLVVRILAQPCQLAVEIEDRIRVILLVCQVDLCIVGVDSQPWLPGREAGVL